MNICINIPALFSFRYEYDDHYFLTDPKEFIYEFFPLQSEWQLLKNPITLEEFEELPFVRSLFFRYQLSFPSDNMKSVMRTDSTGKRNNITKKFDPKIYYYHSCKYRNNVPSLLFRCCNNQVGNAESYAKQPNFSLQFEVLRQRH